jgi:Ca2+/Na+ antiporter
MTNLKIILKILLLIAGSFALFTYVRMRKMEYYSDKRNSIDKFYLFYLIGITFYCFDMHILAIPFYFTAMVFYIKGYYVSSFFMYWRQWRKTSKLSILNQLLILFSFKIDSDLERYIYDKKREQFLKEYNEFF